MSHSPRGSLWNRWDLHFHTPSSFDYRGGAVSNKEITHLLIEEGIAVVAITDHHRIDTARIRELRTLAGDRITILPGLELRDDHGGKPVHYICLFPEDCALDDLWTTIQGTLELTPKGIADKGGDDRVYVPIERGADLARRLGGVVSIHAGERSNSIEEIRNREQFQQRIKYDITQQCVDLMEVGQLKDIDVHLRTIFPITGLDKPLIVGSDNHDASRYEIKAPLWIRADTTFRGLLMVMREPRDRVYIGQVPPQVARVRENPTKYIREVSFRRRASAPATDQWFQDRVEFNTGLIAIVGNKGSGKSALADTLGLLGSTRNAHAFSFLSRGRFNHPSEGKGKHFDATLEWVSGEKTTRCLADSVPANEVERLKYLPQDHVEMVCNDLESLAIGGFERELKSVIFSHVPETSRLEQTSLDDLVQFQTSEKQKRIDALLRQLREISRQRANAEAKLDPAAKDELEDNLRRRELELEAHDKVKPAEVLDPRSNAEPSPEAAGLLQELSTVADVRQKLGSSIAEAEAALRDAQRRQAVAKKLLERIDNFAKEFEAFQTALANDAKELGLDPTALAALTLRRDQPAAIQRDSAAKVVATTQQLDVQDPPGLRAQLAQTDARLQDLRSRLDAPNRAFQSYLAALAQWNARRQAILGSESDPLSVSGLRATLTSLERLPEQVAVLRDQQLRLAAEIHGEKLAQTEVYRTLYSGVQAFIAGHSLAKDRLKLEFRAELMDEGFTDRLLDLLALNRRGSFMGAEEGRARAESFVETVCWDSPESVQAFLRAIDEALHTDQREARASAVVQLKDQLAKSKRVETVFDMLYGLEYVQPRYVLRWEGKDLSMLSPGERGTLLLVFYLLIDKGDLPLIIDQPEGNLDNHTVAKVLVECIKEAARRRQVFIVTHNPNLAVVCDADQVVHASIDKAGGNLVTYTSGSLENPEMVRYVTDVLEGTRWAFGVRGAKYEVGDPLP